MQIVLSQGWVTVDVGCPSQIHRLFTSQVKAKPGIKTNPFAIKSEVDDFIAFSFGFEPCSYTPNPFQGASVTPRKQKTNPFAVNSKVLQSVFCLLKWLLIGDIIHPTWGLAVTEQVLWNLSFWSEPESRHFNFLFVRRKLTLHRRTTDETNKVTRRLTQRHAN